MTKTSKTARAVPASWDAFDIEWHACTGQTPTARNQGWLDHDLAALPETMEYARARRNLIARGARRA